MSFKLEKSKYVKEVGGVVSLFRHDTNATIVHAESNDTNKVFTIVFKTPVENSSGTPHVLEHILLHNSNKYRSSDMFNELSISTNHTYLNAITFRDKTIYAFATHDKAEYLKIADVYLDGIFNPLVENFEGLFAQEINVCCNEMKSAVANKFANINDGRGQTDEMKSLTLENVLDYYKQFYVASNCYIYIYGDVDKAEIFPLIEKYLQETLMFNEKKADKKQGATVNVCNLENNLNINISLENKLSAKKEMAFQLLFDYLLKFEPSPLRQILFETLPINSLNFTLDFEVDYTLLNIKCHLKNEQTTNVSTKEIETIINKLLSDVLTNGFDDALLEHCFKAKELFLRKEDFGYKPKGLWLGLNCLNGLMNNMDIFKHFSPIKTVEKLRESNWVLFELIWSDLIFATNISYKQGKNKQVAYIDLQRPTSNLSQNSLPEINILLFIFNKTKRLQDFEVVHAFEIEQQENDYCPIIKTSICTLKTNLPKVVSELNALYNEFQDFLSNVTMEQFKQLLILLEQETREQILAKPCEYAILRASSRLVESANYKENVCGISFLNYLENVNKNFEAEGSQLLKSLNKNVFATFTPIDNTRQPYSFQNANFPTSAETFDNFPNTNVACLAFKHKQNDLLSKEKLDVLFAIINNYLFETVREKGGAYYVRSGYLESGIIYFVSQNDPNLRQTLDIFAQTISTFDKISSNFNKKYANCYLQKTNNVLKCSLDDIIIGMRLLKDDNNNHVIIIIN